MDYVLIHMTDSDYIKGQDYYFVSLSLFHFPEGLLPSSVISLCGWRLSISWTEVS